MSSLKVNDKIHGFTVTAVTEIPEYKGRGIRLIHDETGLDLYHLHNNDKENLFSFIFKTPASDSTGAAHILEHCVLAGSQKYPIKDPFLSMMNGSMNTFLNAMTYPDKTVYPAASMVKKDYFNLMSVYADAVFFPLLKQEVFMQEGIRFEPDEDGSALPGGVVFNEMKGSYSSHDSIASEFSYRLLFPDTPYKHDAGGEPEEIPGLSYRSFLDFHKKYYHPSNCRVFLYGDIDTAEQLKFLQENALKMFDGRSPSAGDIDFQRDWTGPRSERVTSPLPEESTGEDLNDSTIAMSWKCGSTEDSLNILIFEVLSEALMGNMGAPLYKAVVESGIGEDLSPVSGLDTDLREIVFSVGVRGAAEEGKEKFEVLITDALKNLSKNGISEVSLQGALHKVEFRNREKRGGAPFGLRLMGRSLKGWLHGEPPEQTIGFEEPMRRLKARLSDNPRYFEELIDRWLLKNKHRMTLCIVPDKNHNHIMEERIESEIKSIRGDYKEEELRLEKQRIEAFWKFQETPDSPENLSKIPSLDIEDLPKEIRRIKTERKVLRGVPLYLHDLFTNGIIYLDFAIDIRDISDKEGMLLPFLSRMICSSGLPDVPYDEVALDLALKTGGLYTFLESSRTADGKLERKDFLFFRMKTLETDLDEAFTLVSSLLLNAEITDRARVKDLLFEMRNDFKASILPAGHSYCAVRSGAEFDRVIEREDEWRGSRQLLFLSGLAQAAESNIDVICKSLEDLRDRLFIPERLSLNITCGKEHFDRAAEKLDGFLGSLPGPDDPDINGAVRLPIPAVVDLEKTPSFRLGALSVPSAVYFTAVTMPSAVIGTPLHAHESLLAHLMKTNYLWEEVRMKNGAYGVYASVNGTEGLLTVSTYRDPNPLKNMEALKGALESASKGFYGQADLTKAVITVVGRDTKPLGPGEESLIGFRRVLYRITDEIRQHKREAMLDCSPEDIAAAADILMSRLPEAVTIIMAPESVLAAIAEKHGSGILENKLVLPV